MYYLKNIKNRLIPVFLLLLGLYLKPQYWLIKNKSGIIFKRKIVLKLSSLVKGKLLMEGE